MFLRYLILTIFFPFLAIAGGFEQGTLERGNLEQVLDLLESTPSPEATQIAWRIRKTLDTADNDLGVHDTKDYFGEFNAEGRTFRWMETTIRADRALPNYAFDMTSANMKDYRKGLALMNVMVHEMYHYEDYVNNGGIGSSPENKTYPRGHKLMYTVLNFKVFKDYLIALKNGEGTVQLKRNRALVYMQTLSKELRSYNESDHGAYVKKDFNPLHRGNTCWRPLNRIEAANYLIHTRLLINDNSKTYKQVIDGLENLINYKYPGKIGKECVKDSPQVGLLNNQDPVGRQGPLIHQKMYRLRMNSSKHRLVLEKTSSHKKFNVEIFSLNGMARGVKTLKYEGILYSFYDRYDYTVGNLGEKILILSGDISLPTGLNAFAYYYDDDNKKISYNVGLTPISDASQSDYGYHPIYEKNFELIFDNHSVSARASDHRFEAIEFLAKQNDYIHVSIPQLDSRNGTLMRLTGKMDARGVPEQVFVASLYSFYTTLGIRLIEAGRYILYVERDSDSLRYNRNLKVNFQLSRNGKDAPTLADAKIVTPQRFAMFGNHTPLMKHFNFSLSDKNVQRMQYPFYWHKMIDLKTSKGNIIHYRDVHINDNRVVLIMKRGPDGFQEVNRIYSFEDYKKVRIYDDLPHYLVFMNDSAHVSSRTVGFSLTKFHQGSQAPDHFIPEYVDNATQAGFNLFPIRVIKDNVRFDKKTSKGLIYGNQYRLITFNMPANGIIYFYNSTHFIRRRFVLFKIDEEKFEANQPSLKNIHYSYSWETSFSKEMTSGKYALAIESEDRSIVEGEAFFKMSISLDGVSPHLIHYQKVTNQNAVLRKYELIPSALN